MGGLVPVAEFQFAEEPRARDDTRTGLAQLRWIDSEVTSSLVSQNQQEPCRVELMQCSQRSATAPQHPGSFQTQRSSIKT